MPSTRGGAAAEALTSPVERKTPKGHFSVSTLHGRLTEQRSKLKTLQAAERWLAEDSARTKAEAAKEFDIPSYKLKYHLSKAGKRAENHILTEKEELRLVEWIEGSADNLNSACFEEISIQVRKYLMARNVRNKNPSTPVAARVPLTKHERRLVADNRAHVSKRWMQRFFGLYADRIQYKAEKKQDAKRTKKQTEATVRRHFEGAFGLRAELSDAQVMDKEGRIDDPRRLINLDEVCQFLDYQTQRSKCAGRTGKALQRSGHENRETVSVTTIGDLGGFIYGLHAIVARKHHSVSMTDCLHVPEHFHSFDDQIYLFESRSTYSLISTTDKGVQTGKSFLEMLKWLKEQIDHRNQLEVRTLSVALSENRSALTVRSAAVGGARQAADQVPRRHLPR